MSGEVLIVGAGPSGLAAALELARHGVRARVVDRRPGPSPQSRATILHVRTLEAFDRFGLAAEAVALGTPVTDVEVRAKGRTKARIRIAGGGAEGRTRFPCTLSLPQCETERMLSEALATHGVRIEWNHTVDRVAPAHDGVRVTLRGPDQPITRTASWLVAADGAASTVRSCLGIPFDGITYPQTMMLADVTLNAGLPPGGSRVSLGRAGFFGYMPLDGGRYRLFGAVPPDFTWRPEGETTSHDAYARLPEAELRRWFADYFQAGSEVRQIHWASLFRVHGRTAGRFRAGRVFLVGDAAHAHSPAGGQGLNLGIGDAINLAWKLALVQRGQAPPELLDSYERERRPLAHTIVRNAHRGFRLETFRNPLVIALRTHLAMPLLGAASRLRPVRRLLFRMISQNWIAYRRGPAMARGPRPGDRAPHAPLGTGSVLDVLRPGGFHLLLFAGRSGRSAPGHPTAPATAARAWAGRYATPVQVHAVPRREQEAHKAYRARRPRAVLLRPDGHIAWTGPPARVPTRLDHLLLSAPKRPVPLDR